MNSQDITREICRIMRRLDKLKAEEECLLKQLCDLAAEREKKRLTESMMYQHRMRLVK